MIRAKFRCMSISDGLNDSVQIRLAAVIPKKGLPNFEENKQFWEYSPNGECLLTYTGRPMLIGVDNVSHAFEVGSFYFIDMEKTQGTDPKNSNIKDADGVWQLARREDHINGYGSVDFNTYPKTGQLKSGELKIGLSEKADGAKAAFGAPAWGWSIGFHFAHGAELE